MAVEMLAAIGGAEDRGGADEPDDARRGEDVPVARDGVRDDEDQALVLHHVDRKSVV